MEQYILSIKKNIMCRDSIIRRRGGVRNQVVVDT